MKILERIEGTWIPTVEGKYSTAFRCSRCKRNIVIMNNNVEAAWKEATEEYPYCHCGCFMNAGKGL